MKNLFLDPKRPPYVLNQYVCMFIIRMYARHYSFLAESLPLLGELVTSSSTPLKFVSQKYLSAVSFSNELWNKCSIINLLIGAKYYPQHCNKFI